MSQFMCHISIYTGFDMMLTQLQDEINVRVMVVAAKNNHLHQKEWTALFMILQFCLKWEHLCTDV